MQSEVRAVLRLPLHCGPICRMASASVGYRFGQSYDCPSIAGLGCTSTTPVGCARSDDLTSAAPLRHLGPVGTIRCIRTFRLWGS